MNTPCSHLHIFCAAGVSSGLAVLITLTAVSRGSVGESSFVYHSTLLILGCLLSGTFCISGRKAIHKHQNFISSDLQNFSDENIRVFRRLLFVHLLSWHLKQIAFLLLINILIIVIACVRVEGGVRSIIFQPLAARCNNAQSLNYYLQRNEYVHYYNGIVCKVTNKNLHLSCGVLQH